MDTIRFLLNFMIRVAVVLFLVALVWWLVAVMFPALSVRNLFSQTGTSTEDWLPAPGSMKGLFSDVVAPNGNDNVYNPGDAYNGYSNAYNNNQGGADVDYITYTSTGTQIIRGSNSRVSADVPDSQTGYSTTALYIRNLSIYTGGHIYTGLSFTGEARSVMFRNGQLQIIIADVTGRPVANALALAVGNQSVDGWTHFQTRIISVLPNRIRCQIIFQQPVSQYAYQPQQPIRVAIPVLCN